MKDIKSTKNIVSKQQVQKNVAKISANESLKISYFSVTFLTLSICSVMFYVFLVSSTVYYSVHLEKNVSALETLQFTNFAIESSLISDEETTKKNISYINKQNVSAISLK